MAHSVLDQVEYEALTGKDLDTAEAKRYHTVVELAKAQLEELLGWPLVPSDWENQYIEIGKSKSNTGSCPDADTDVDPADEVVGRNRFYTLEPGEPWLPIDPATTIHSVKVVRNGYTCKEYDEDEYVPKYVNGNPSTIKFIGIRKFMCDCVHVRKTLTFAVDADWAYAPQEDGTSTLPMELKKILADMIAEQMDPKRDVRSESVVSHSYTKFDRAPIIEQDQVRKTLWKYAGPKGTVTRRLT